MDLDNQEKLSRAAPNLVVDREPPSIAVELAWARVRAALRSELQEEVFKNWIKPATLIGRAGGEIRLGMPSTFRRDFLVTHYAQRLLELWRQEDRGITGIDVLVVGDVAPAAPVEEARLDIDPPFHPDYTFENFVVGKSNQFAYAAALRVAEADGPSPYNPLFLYSQVGLGKTHLLNAIAWRYRERFPDRSIAYLSAENFVNRFVRAIRDKDMISFKDQFRNVHLLLVDDVQFLAGKDQTQEELFHTFNALVEAKRQLVISADKSPFELKDVEERLRSRLGWGLVAEINQTNFELRLSILMSKAERMGAGEKLPREVLEFLAHRVTSSIRELEGAFTRIVGYADLMNQTVTLDQVQQLLHDQLRASDRPLLMEEIQKRVCEHFNLKLSDMQSPRRAREVARPRQIAMYLCKQLTTRSLPEIGRKFGGRDHTTVIHAVRKIDELRKADPGLNEDVEILSRKLLGRA
jgi:chromosomal replication initiator protein